MIWQNILKGVQTLLGGDDTLSEQRLVREIVQQITDESVWVGRQRQCSAARFQVSITVSSEQDRRKIESLLGPELDTQVNQRLQNELFKSLPNRQYEVLVQADSIFSLTLSPMKPPAVGLRIEGGDRDGTFCLLRPSATLTMGRTALYTRTPRRTNSIIICDKEPRYVSKRAALLLWDGLAYAIQAQDQGSALFIRRGGQSFAPVDCPMQTTGLQLGDVIAFHNGPTDECVRLILEKHTPSTSNESD